MGELHTIIEHEGKQRALELGWDRSEVEAAAAYMSDDNSGIGFLYSGWCQAALPHKKLPDDQTWRIDTDRLTLLVEPGQKPLPNGENLRVGVPFGSAPRLILTYLQSRAIQTGSPEVELGRNLSEFLTRMGVPKGGGNMSRVRDQAERISRCRLTFHILSGGRQGLMNQNIVDTAMFFNDPRDQQESLFIDTVTLSARFFEQLKQHPVPLAESAIRAISNNSMAIDAYAWLAYRLHVLNGPTPVSWAALKRQFGTGFNRIDHFRTRFTDSLRLAMSVYEDAKLDIEGKAVILYPSPPPVAPRVFQVKLTYPGR